MIGVTIGIGSFQSMAVRAAKTFEEKCNLPAAVLGDEDMRKCGARYPHWLKFHLFDLVDAENVVYFDADTITASDYEPERFQNLESFVVVRDVPSYSTERDGRLLGYPLDRCLNGGWFIASRRHHSEFLRECRKAARHYHWLLFSINPAMPVVNVNRIFFDQPIFNLLIYRMDLPVRFVDRRYNYLAYGCGNLWCMQTDIFVRHFARGLRYSDDVGERSKTTVEQWQVDEGSFETYSGKWRHFRDDEQQCDVVFRPDGTIANWPGLHFWFVSTGKQLVISRWENANFWMYWDRGKWRTGDEKLLLERIE